MASMAKEVANLPQEPADSVACRSLISERGHRIQPGRTPRG